MPIPGHNVNDFIHSAANLKYTKWEKTFAFLPVTTITKQWVWMKTVYKRRRWMLIEPPQFPVNKFRGVEYATSDEIAENFLSGKWD